MSRIALISCCGPKLDDPAPARELYTSDLFRKSVAWAEAKAMPWHVLSALYGLVGADEVVEPYDLRLQSLSRTERVEWAEQVAESIGVAPIGGVAVILAGQTYAGPLVPLLESLGWAIEQPLSGMQIGQRKQWLKANTRGPALPSGWSPDVPHLWPAAGSGRRAQRYRGPKHGWYVAIAPVLADWRPVAQVGAHGKMLHASVGYICQRRWNHPQIDTRERTERSHQIAALVKKIRRVDGAASYAWEANGLDKGKRAGIVETIEEGKRAADRALFELMSTTTAQSEADRLSAALGI